MVREVSFYHKVVFKASAPVGMISLLWCYPLSYALRGQPSNAAVHKVKGLTMLLLELMLPSIATSLVQVFICTHFDNGAFLSEQLTLSCDDSKQRTAWIAFASIVLVVYVLGGILPCLIWITCQPS